MYTAKIMLRNQPPSDDAEYAAAVEGAAMDNAADDEQRVEVHIYIYIYIHLCIYIKIRLANKPR